MARFDDYEDEDDKPRRRNSRGWFASGFGASSGIATGILAVFFGMFLLLVLGCGGCVMLGALVGPQDRQHRTR